MLAIQEGDVYLYLYIVIYYIYVHMAISGKERKGKEDRTTK